MKQIKFFIHLKLVICLENILNIFIILVLLKMLYCYWAVKSNFINNVLDAKYTLLNIKHFNYLTSSVVNATALSIYELYMWQN